MKKYFRFLSLVTIMAIVASISVLAPITANAGSLTNLRVSLSSYDISADGADVNVNMTVEAKLATELSGTDGDKIIITFNEWAVGEEDQFNVGAVVAGDVVVSCDGDANVMDDATVTVFDGEGNASDNIEIVLGTATLTDTCVPGEGTGVLKIVISNNRIRTPYTVDNLDPKGYRIKFDTTTGADVLEDSGTVAVFINAVGANKMEIWGQVDPALMMELGPLSCSLGVLSKDSYSSCGYTLRVGTNAKTGYDATIIADGPLEDALAASEINAVTDGTINNDAIVTTTEYGVAVDTTDTAEDFPDIFPASGYADCTAIGGNITNAVSAAPLSDTLAKTLASATVGVNPDTTGKTDICHIARIKADQPAGSFTQTVTITVTAHF